MKYSVTYSSDFICRLDHTVFCIHKSIKYKLNSDVVILHRCFNNILILSCWLMCKNRTINTDSFYKTLCDNAFIFHID